MGPLDNLPLEDALLRRYLLGALSEAEAERLHELTVTDEEFAGRLDAIENDLVDAYVRDELSQENLERFKTYYLASPRRREKVHFAEGFLALERRADAAPARKETAAPASHQRERSAWSRPVPRLAPAWAFAAAFLGLLVAGGYLFVQNLELRKQMTDVLAGRTSAEQYAQELERWLDQERAARDESLREQNQARGSQGSLDQLRTVSVLLPPPLRGPGPIPTLSLQGGTDLVILVLELESDDFPVYRARLKDPVTGQILWRSRELAASSGEKKAVAVSFRAHLLKKQNYIVDLSGVRSHGPAQAIGSYPFRVVLE